MLTSRCLENLRKIKSSTHQQHHLMDLTDTGLHEFYLEIADQLIPVGNHSGRFEKAKYLVWHIENLRPTIQSDVTAFILRKWPKMIMPTVETTSFIPEKKEIAPVFPTNTFASAQAVPSQPEKQALILLPEPALFQRQKQDWFDILLNWMAVLANLLPMKA